MRRTLIALLVLLLAPAACLAQALSDRIPDDAEIYFAWAGTDSPGAAYDQSHLKAIVDATQISQFINDSLPRLINRIGKEDPNSAELIRKELHLFSPMITHPTAFYFGGIDSINNVPMPKLALICDAGAEAGDIAQEVTRLMAQAGGDNPFTCKPVGSLVVVSDFAFEEHPQHPLSESKQFQKVVASLGKEPFGIVYVDFKQLLATIDRAVQQFAPPEAQQQWPQIRQSLGLDGLQTIAATAGFDGKNWSGQGLVVAPAPRHGLLAMADSDPLSPDLIKLIPQASTFAAGGSFDLNALFTNIDKAIVQYAPDHGDQFHQLLQQVNQTVGIDIQKDLLAALGSQWGAYVDPTTAGPGLLGMTIVNRPRNAQQLEASLGSLEKFANDTIQEQIDQNNGKVTVQFRQFTSGGVNLHYLATPLLSPTWAVKDGTLYLGLFPQIVVSAVNRPADAKSIVDNSDFQAVMKKLGAPDKYNSFSYLDLPKSMPLGYQSWLMISRLYLGFADLLDGQVPPLVFPSLETLVAQTEPAGGVSWSDDAGFHFKSIEPFPGANLLGSGDNLMAAGVGQSALMASIMVPSLTRARETANRVKCASNLHQIAQAILLYSNDHQGNYPPDLGTLIKTEDLTLPYFVCPSSNTAVPTGLTKDQEADWVNAHSDYIYNGAGLNMNKLNNPHVFVVCYEKETDHS